MMVTESLRGLPEGKAPSKSYNKIVESFLYDTSITNTTAEPKTGEEVAEEVAKRLGIKINWGGGAKP